MKWTNNRKEELNVGKVNSKRFQHFPTDSEAMKHSLGNKVNLCHLSKQRREATLRLIRRTLLPGHELLPARVRLVRLSLTTSTMLSELLPRQRICQRPKNGKTSGLTSNVKKEAYFSFFKGIFLLFICFLRKQGKIFLYLFQM